MGFLLDTNVVSDNRRARQVPPCFRQTIESLPEEETFISVLTLTEIHLGIQRQTLRDRSFKAVLEVWLHEVIKEFGTRILPVSQPIALIAGGLPCSVQQPTYDALIAATALHHGHTVVTRNTRDFAPLGVATLDPWRA